MKKLILSLSVIAMLGLVSLPVFASNSLDKKNETNIVDDKKCDKDGKACDKDSKKCDKKEKKSCCSKGKKAE